MSSLPFAQRASWIWSAEGTHAVPSESARSPSHYQVRLFRREFEIPRDNADSKDFELPVHVSADSRYVLYCNGRVVGRGPARGDVIHHFYDTYELRAFAKAGANVLAALVLDMSKVAHKPSELGAPCAIMTYAGGFLLEGDLAGAHDSVTRLDTGIAGWRVAVGSAHRFQNDGTKFEGYHGYFEHRVARDEPAGWNAIGFDASSWPEATVLYTAERYENRRDPTSPYGLVERIIPQLPENPPGRFESCSFPGGEPPGEGWDSLLTNDRSIVIPPGRSVQLVVDTGKLTTAYPELITSGGADSNLRLTYAEALRLPWSTEGAQFLGRPQSLANLASHFADETSGWTFDRRGSVTGWSDVWEPAGRERERFEPWHWRAFRYIGIEITTGTEPLTIHSLRHRFAGYPFGVTARFECSDARLGAIWETALHTMRLCSHETFEDCPHYEQMQYAGDTMITSRLAMLTSGDYRLTLQALLHFDWSRLPEGITQSRFPSRLLQVIPSWSLHWITCIRDYAYCSGDLATVGGLMPGARAVLDWFRRHADSDGLPAKLPFWNITDWCAWWPRGVVPGADSGPTCIIASQYIHALDEVADLARLTGDAAFADRLGAEAESLRVALNARFWSEEQGLYFDRPGGPEVSQYGNAWAVVCGAAGEKQRRRLMARFPTDPQLAPGSFFCWHAVFRALELCGSGDTFTDFLGPWHEQIERGLDTFVEENSYWRSLCHAWSAHPALEFMTRVLGVTAAAPGFAKIDIKPHRCGLAHASGLVCTPAGQIEVAWRVEDRRFIFTATTPEEADVCITLPDGASHQVRGGKIELECPIE
jgi:alpha-L-rhamnosidase